MYRVTTISGYDSQKILTVAKHRIDCWVVATADGAIAPLEAYEMIDRATKRDAAVRAANMVRVEEVGGRNLWDEF